MLCAFDKLICLYIKAHIFSNITRTAEDRLGTLDLPSEPKI